MKKIDLGQTVSILANIGVIAGIVFLGYELQQNNKLLAAQARSERVALRQADNALPLENPDLTQALVKSANDESLTAYETVLVSRYMDLVLINFQPAVRELERGLIDEASVPADLWSRSFGNSDDGWNIVNGRPSMREFWEANRSGYDEDFVSWMEQNVVYR